MSFIIIFVTLSIAATLAGCSVFVRACGYLGGSVLLPERRATAATHRSSRGRVPRGTGVLPDQRRDDPPVQGERGISDGEEESFAEQAVAEEGLAFLRGTGELKGRKGINSLRKLVRWNK